MSLARAIAEAQRLAEQPGLMRGLRVAAGVPLEVVATDLNVDVSTVSRWERGLRRPRAKHVVAWVELIRGLS